MGIAGTEYHAMTNGDQQLGDIDRGEYRANRLVWTEAVSRQRHSNDHCR